MDVALRHVPCLRLFRYTSSTPSTIDAIFCSLILYVVSQWNVTSWVEDAVPVEKTLQLSDEFHLSFRLLSVFGFGELPKMWRYVFGR